MDQHSAYKHSYKFERRTASLYVQNTGRQQCSPTHSWGPGVRNHYLIHHVIAGKGTYVVQNQRHELSAGDTFLIYPDTSIHYFADSQDPWEYIWVGFDGIDAKHYVDQMDFTPQRPVLRGLHAGEIRRLLEDIYSDYGSGVWRSAAITGRLYLLMAFLVEHATKVPAARASGSDCAKDAANYIMTHFEEPITVEGLADFASVSHSSLYRSFKRRFQMSPKRFLLEYRIERACMLLTDSSYSIQEISNSVGFEDPFYFSRAFKSIKGVSPRQFAAAAAKNAQRERKERQEPGKESAGPAGPADPQ